PRTYRPPVVVFSGGEGQDIRPGLKSNEHERRGGSSPSRRSRGVVGSHRDVDEVEDFRATILARQTEAEEAFVQGDPRPRMELWSRQDPVTLFGAIGMSESGWEQLSRTF